MWELYITGYQLELFNSKINNKRASGKFIINLKLIMRIDLCNIRLPQDVKPISLLIRFFFFCLNVHAKKNIDICLSVVLLVAKQKVEIHATSQVKMISQSWTLPDQQIEMIQKFI